MPWFKLLLGCHIVAGVCAFVVAPIALNSRKGGTVHRRAGWLYFGPMSFAAASAALLAALTYNATFVWIGLFSLYLGLSGFRAIRLRVGSAAGWGDAIFAWSWLGFFVAMLGWGSAQLPRDLGRAIPVLSFAATGLWLVSNDLRRLLPSHRGTADRVIGHMDGMISSYLAAVSAFSVVNLVGVLPLPVRILWAPTIGLPLLLVWRARVRRRMLAGATP